MRSDYKSWLANEEYAENTQVAQINRVQKVEQYYGNLDEVYAAGSYDAVIAQLNYSVSDERMGKPNPSKIVFEGNIRNNLQSYKNAVVRYRKFLHEVGDAPSMPTIKHSNVSPLTVDEEVTSEKQRLSLERDMQAALRVEISQLDASLIIIDDGAERAVSSGFIDILCRDNNGATVVVELKAGKTDARVVGQILGYMGDLITEDELQSVRGIIVAHEFDKRTLAAARAVPNLKLVRYSVKFHFESEA